MSAWSWVIVGAAALFLFSVAVSFALAAILGHIGQEVSELLEEPNLWANAPLTREEIQAEQDAPTERSTVSDRIGAHGSHR
jgi:hypothetical protein